jgi:membrane-associated phospholipid phosphatase
MLDKYFTQQLISQQITKMGNPDFDKSPNNSLVTVVHDALKGRTRYKVSGLYNSQVFKTYLESKLSKQDGIKEVRANTYTGNVLVFFHPQLNPSKVTEFIQELVLNYRNKSSFNADIQPQPPAQQIRLKQSEGKLILASGTTVCALTVAAGMLHLYGLDEPILLAIQKLHTPLFNRIILSITLLGEPAVILLVCLGLRYTPIYHNRPREADTLAIAALGATGINCLLKLMFARTRPALWDWIIHVGHYSFPSGHSMISMATYGYIGYTLANQYPQYEREIIALTAVLIMGIGFSRLYLGVHWPTDVAVGYAAGLLWLVRCIHKNEQNTIKMTT